MVSLTFEDQNNGDKIDINTKEATADPVLCTARSSAALVQNTLSLPRGKLDTSICSVIKEVLLRYITPETLLKEFRSTLTAIGEAKIVSKPKYIGTHSVRSGSKMVMFLDNVPIFLVVLSGTWSSYALLKYTRKKVMEFGNKTSSIMIKNE